MHERGRHRAIRDFQRRAAIQMPLLRDANHILRENIQYQAAGRGKEDEHPAE
ncbi:MAG: hypothetical protein HW378_4703, partial [Anaerolineales bacterium]|nr:hypothetical protein [Anaerolineales bacterium]